MAINPKFFRSAGELRRWLEKHHASENELWIGFHNKASGLGGATYQEAVDEALCFGWIDGVRKKVDETSYVNRFTPRKPKSKWSTINIRRVEELKKLGPMAPAGLAAFAKREKSAYSFESESKTFEPTLAAQLEANPKAHAFFSSRPPGYRKIVTHWVMSAKKEETRVRRMGVVVACSERGEKIPMLAD
jgi:uncharacterized protein YdeI (YjbR/CyaY-like superfamily)